MTRIATRGLAIGLALAALAGAPVSAEVVKLGVLAPLTGPAAADGEEFVKGAQMGVDEINAAGGVAGYTFELEVADVKDQSADAVATGVERLLGDRDMGVIMTGYASGSNFEIEMMAEQEMPYLIGANSAQTAEIISPSPDDFPTVWSFTPSFDGYNTEIVPVIEDLASSGKLDLPAKTVAIITSDNPYSKTIAEGMVKSFEAAGWEVTAYDTVPFGEVNDWRSFLSQVRQNPPGVLINTDYLPGNAATFMTQFMEDPTDSLVFIQYAPSVPEFLELTKEASSGVVYNMLGGTLNTPKAERAVEVLGKYQEKYGTEPGPYGPALYEMVMTYADALEEVGDPQERLAIGEAIGKMTRETSGGVLAFDPATHLAVQDEDHIPIQFYQIVDGKRVLFYPPKYATGEFAEPGWMK